MRQIAREFLRIILFSDIRSVQSALWYLMWSRIRQADEICSSLSVLQEDVLRQKKNLLKKRPHLFVFKRSQIEYLWMVLMAEHLRAQWDILLLFIDILTKYFIVLSNLSRQHHSAGTQFGFFKIQTNVGFLSKYLFFCQKTSSWSTGFWYTISRVRPSLRKNYT